MLYQLSYFPMSRKRRILYHKFPTVCKGVFFLFEVPQFFLEIPQFFSGCRASAAACTKNGTPIPTDDVWIAAGALESGGVLFTRDRQFDRIPILRTIRLLGTGPARVGDRPLFAVANLAKIARFSQGFRKVIFRRLCPASN